MSIRSKGNSLEKNRTFKPKLEKAHWSLWIYY